MPRRPPLRPDPLSPHGARLTIVKRLIAPAELAKKGAWGRELAVLKRLQKQFCDETFWLTLRPAIRLDSLTWFESDYGRAALQQEWNAYVFARESETQSVLDLASRPAMIEDTAEEDLPAIRPRRNAIDWADGA